MSKRREQSTAGRRTALRLLIVEGAEGEGDFDPCEILEFLSV